MKFKILHFDTVSSTNTVVFEHAEAGAAEGLVIAADYQSGGRGQFDRKWISPAGKNLLFSLLLKPDVPAYKAPLVTQLAAQAIAKVLKKDYNLSAQFKRPNDLMIEGKKLCGILTEASTAGGKVLLLVIGVGLNVNAAIDDLVPGAISMKDITGKTYSLKPLLSRILKQLKIELKGYHAGTS